MPIKKTLISGAVLAALIIPGSVAAGADFPNPVSTTPAAQQTAAPATDPKAAAAAKLKAAKARAAKRRSAVRHRKALKRVTRLARTRAKLRGRRHRGHRYLRTVSKWSTRRLKRHSKRLTRSVRLLRRTGGAPNVAIPPALHSIARCESGGNPRAVSASGTYRGLFQFDYGTWASVGGKGDPAAASATEQYRRAAMLYARRGAAPWPVCGR